MNLPRAADVVARVRALRPGDSAAGGGVLRYRDLVLDPARHEVRRGGRAIDLTPTEFALLMFFLQRPEQVVTRSEIFAAVWQFDFGAHSNLLHVYVGYLRRKTEAGREPRLLHTVRGVGYLLQARS